MPSMDQSFLDDIAAARSASPDGLDWLLSHYILRAEWDWVGQAISVTWNDEDYSNMRAAHATKGVPVPSRYIFEFKQHHYLGIADNWALGYFKDFTLIELCHRECERAREVQTAILSTILRDADRYCQSDNTFEGRNLLSILAGPNWESRGFDYLRRFGADGLTLLDFLAICAAAGPRALIAEQSAREALRLLDKAADPKKVSLEPNGLVHLDAESRRVARVALVGWWRRRSPETAAKLNANA
jgi:hypothetical protein